MAQKKVSDEKLTPDGLRKTVAPGESLMGNPGDFFIRLCKITQVAGIVQIRPLVQVLAGLG